MSHCPFYKHNARLILEYLSSEEMREAIEVQDTSATVRTRQSELKERHRQELQELYDFEAKQYFAEALNKYLSKDEFERGPPLDVRPVHHNRSLLDDLLGTILIQRLYAFSREPLHSTSTTSFATSYEAYRYSYLQTMLPLHQQHQDLCTQEAQVQRQKDARFPMNVGQYRNIYNRETLLRIARFLTGDASTKEKIMDEYGWVHRQTFNLEQSYEHDVSHFQGFVCQATRYRLIVLTTTQLHCRQTSGLKDRRAHV